MLPTNRASPAAFNSSPQSTETLNKSSDEILFETLMKDPIKKAFLLNILSQEKENIQRYKRRDEMVNKTPVKVQSQKYCESPTALLRRRALQRNRDSDSSSTRSPPTPSTPVDFGELLKGVVAYVEIRSKGEDRSAGAKMLMQSMGATVLDVLNRKVTHVVFKDGSFGTYQKAKLLKVHLVSVLWLEAIRKSNIRVSERNYPALGTDSYDINVSALYQDYENVVRDEQRRSLAAGSQRSAFASQKRSRLTMLPSELYSTNRESVRLRERMSDIVRSSQEYETESIISFKGPLSNEPPDSATLLGRGEENIIEMTSDDDSEVGMINGHSMSQVRDSAILDLDAQLSQHPEQDRSNSTGNRISKSLSTPSESLLSRKSLSKTNDMIVDMKLTANRSVSLDEESTRSNGSRQSCRSLPLPQLTLPSVARRTKSSETMPSLRISGDSVPTQPNMPPLRISETESDTRRTRSSADKVDMAPLRISTESELNNNTGSESSTKKRNTHRVSQVVPNSPSSTKRKLSDRSDENNVPLNSDLNKSGSTVDDGNPPSQTESVGSKKLRRKLFNLNQAIDPATQSLEVVEDQPQPQPALNTKILVVPLPRMSFDAIGGFVKPSKNIVVFPIRKKRRYLANKKLRNGLKSTKKVLTNAKPTKKNESVDEYDPVSTQQLKSSKDAPDRRHSTRIENAKTPRTDQSDKEEIVTTSDDQAESPAKRRCTIRINASQSHISSQLQNRRSTGEFLAHSSTKTQRSQKAKAGKPSIVCTRLHRSDVQMFMQIVRKLGVFLVEDEVSKKTTHLVVGECKRTVNLLRALCRGCWILTHEWLLRSLEAGKWLPEEDYELTDFSSAVQQCRRERQVFGKLYCMDIFTDCGAMYVSRNSTPRRSDLEELIRLCNGTVAKEIYHAKIIVGDWVRSDEITCVNEKWILDSITFNKKKSFKNYLFKFPK
uniref:BRCT domain-containing protein n=1 Tax=Photinus pyralis TaxID=7054 RepID=A0A1Y1L3Q4_PHOPY